MFYEEVFKLFNSNKIRYVVVGGIALNLHGVPRTTADLDVVLALDEENLKNTVELLISMGFESRLPVRTEELYDLSKLDKWKKEKNLLGLNFWNSARQYEEVDIIIEIPLKFEEIEKNQELVKAGDITIPIISIDDLIALKAKSHREQDRADIEALNKIKRMK